MSRPVAKEPDKRILRLYRKGLNLVEIALKVKRTTDTIRRHLRLAKIERVLGPLHDHAAVAAKYDETKSYSATARHFRVSRQAVWAALNPEEEA